MKILDVLNNLEKTLAVGWDSYNAEPPTQEVYLKAQKYIEEFGERILKIYPHTDGGLVLNLEDKEVEIYNDGEIWVDEFGGGYYRDETYN